MHNSHFSDFRKLARDFPEAKAEKMIEQCLDLSTMFNEINNTSGRKSMEKLVAQVLNLRISKDKSVRMSQWNVLPLSDAQKLYAAIDVYVSSTEITYRE
jgi:ribonuclease D